MDIFSFLNLFQKLPALEKIILKTYRIIGEKPPMNEAMAIFAGFQALMAAIQVLQNERDYQRAKQTFQQTYTIVLDSRETMIAARALVNVAPREVIKKLHDNAKKCWDHWLDFEEEPLMPGQEREADEAVKKCVCRQLKRMIDLDGSLRPEWEGQWDLYNCDATYKVKKESALRTSV